MTSAPPGLNIVSYIRFKTVQFQEKQDNLAFKPHEFIPDEKVFVERITNHANKDVLNIFGKRIYLSADGAKLGDFPGNFSGMHIIGQGQEPLIDAGEIKEVESPAMFMPPNTRSSRFEISRVEFVDGTKWSPRR